MPKMPTKRPFAAQVAADNAAAAKAADARLADINAQDAAANTALMERARKELRSERAAAAQQAQSDASYGALSGLGQKKGGKVKKMASGGMAKAQKPAAKGWGKARGARGAKYY